jgi:hypothetical protein
MKTKHQYILAISIFSVIIATIYISLIPAHLERKTIADKRLDLYEQEYYSFETLKKKKRN